MLTGLFVSPNDIRLITEPAVGGGAVVLSDGIHYRHAHDRRAVILPGNTAIYRAGEKVVQKIEEEAHLSISDLERITILITGQGMDIIPPLCKALPTERLVWLLCDSPFIEAKARIVAASRGDLHIVRAKHCETSDKVGEHVVRWLCHGPSDVPTRPLMEMVPSRR